MIRGISVRVTVVQTDGIVFTRPVHPLDQIAGPLVISAFLFFAILANFIFRGAPPLTHMIMMIFRL